MLKTLFKKFEKGFLLMLITCSLAIREFSLNSFWEKLYLLFTLK